MRRVLIIKGNMQKIAIKSKSEHSNKHLAPQTTKLELKIQSLTRREA